MRKIILLFSIILFSSTSLVAQQKVWDETEAQKAERMQWWTYDRFGMFIHWELYAIPGRGE